MIAPDEDFAGAPLLRKEYRLDSGHGEVASAQLHLSALGVCEAWINGVPVSPDLLTPGWSSYEWRVRYRTLDVTGLLPSSFVIGIALGNGWYRGRLTWTGRSRFYGSQLAAWAQLDLQFANGHRQRLGTDESWRCGPSAVTANDLYDGQSIDARRLDHSWQQPRTPVDRWTTVHAIEFDSDRLSPYIGPPVVRQDELAPQRVWTSPGGNTLVDFGQNLVGWVRVRLCGEPGSEVTLRHAEVLEDGELATRPLRSAQGTDRYVLSGGEDVLEPTFTFHGFRYTEVSGYPRALPDGSLTAVVVGSDLTRTGNFECSHSQLNQLFRNVVWGTRGNFLDVPTDCPQRDERLGWTGDIAVFAPAAAFLYDVKDFLRDWLLDLALEQRNADGMVPFVVPDVLKYIEVGPTLPRQETTAIWSDASVWVPWALWQAYGDTQVLSDQFESMTAHTRRVRSLLSPSRLWDTGFQFGDWLDPGAPPDEPFRARADPGVVATACAYRTAALMTRIAAILDKAEEEQEFGTMAAGLRQAFIHAYLDEDGKIFSDCPTVYALAIAFDLLEGADRDRAGDRLAELVAENGYRIATGFAGTPFICDALSSTGHLEDAYRLILQDRCPSWLYPITMGATTIWERWDSMLPDGSINPGEMTSFNHYALGAVADWMRRTIGGLGQLEPGYRTLLVAPRPGGGLTWARTTLNTPHGHAAVHWQLIGNRLDLQVTVPAGTTAVVHLVGQPDQVLEPGQHRIITAANA
jgi:alpha-L-rhamnosidase